MIQQNSTNENTLPEINIQFIKAMLLFTPNVIYLSRNIKQYYIHKLKLLST